MKIELEVEWDHGPDITLVIYAKRTHILTVAWSSYPVLGGAARNEPDSISPERESFTVPPLRDPPPDPDRYQHGGPRH